MIIIIMIIIIIIIIIVMMMMMMIWSSTSTKWFFVYPIPDRIGIWKRWFLRRGGSWSTRRKTSLSKGENHQQTQITYGVDARISTWPTLGGGVCSHHCSTLPPPPPPQFIYFVATLFSQVQCLFGYCNLISSPPRLKYQGNVFSFRMVKKCSSPRAILCRG